MDRDVIEDRRQEWRRGDREAAAGLAVTAAMKPVNKVTLGKTARSARKEVIIAKVVSEVVDTVCKYSASMRLSCCTIGRCQGG